MFLVLKEPHLPSHVKPIKPGLHEHEKDVPWSVHVPEFLHGELEQASET